jgi:hypothetical protein
MLPPFYLISHPKLGPSAIFDRISCHKRPPLGISLFQFADARRRAESLCECWSFVGRRGENSNEFSTHGDNLSNHNSALLFGKVLRNQVKCDRIS